jgi:hypothetical protein
LMELRDRNVGTATCDDRDDLFAVPASERKALNEEPIPGDDGLGLPGLGVNGGDATAMTGIVVDVIVNQRGGVNEFKRQSEGHDIFGLGPACKFVGEEKQERTQAFSTRIEHSSGFNRNLSSTSFHFGIDEAMQFFIDLVAHGLKRSRKNINIAAHTPRRTVGFLTSRPRP